MLTQHKHREHAGRSELPLLRQQLSFSLNCFICSYWHNAENPGSRPQPRWGKQLEAPLTPSIEATVQYSFTWHTTIEATVEYSLTRQGTIEATKKKTHRGFQLHSTPSHHSDHISVKIPDIVNSIKSVQIGSCDGKAPALHPHICWMVGAKMWWNKTITHNLKLRFYHHISSVEAIFIENNHKKFFEWLKYRQGVPETN